MDTVALWEEEIIESQNSVFTNMNTGMNMLSESITFDIKLIDEGVITEGNVLQTLGEKIKKLITMFKKFCRKLFAKIRAFVQQKLKKSNETIFNKLCERIEKHGEDYTNDEKVKKYADKYNEVLDKELKQFGDSKQIGLASNNGKIRSFIDTSYKRMNSICKDLKSDEYNFATKGISTKGSVKVQLGDDEYLSDKITDQPSTKNTMYIDSTVSVDGLYVSNFPTKSNCDEIKNITTKVTESNNVVAGFLEITVDGPLGKAFDEFSDLVNNSSLKNNNINYEDLLVPYKTAMTNVKKYIADLKSLVQDASVYNLNALKAMGNIQNSFIAIYNKVL